MSLKNFITGFASLSMLLLTSAGVSAQEVTGGATTAAKPMAASPVGVAGDARRRRQ